MSVVDVVSFFLGHDVAASLLAEVGLSGVPSVLQRLRVDVGLLGEHTDALLLSVPSVSSLLLLPQVLVELQGLVFDFSAVHFLGHLGVGNGRRDLAQRLGEILGLARRRIEPLRRAGGFLTQGFTLCW